MADFVVKFSEPSAFSFKFGANSAFSFKFGELGANFDLKFGGSPIAEIYRGNYSVTPQVNGQVMATANKYMKNDMEIKAIPIYFVGNEGGGDTVNIASDFELAILGNMRLGEVML